MIERMEEFIKERKEADENFSKKKEQGGTEKNYWSR